jgi:hypothetical protein
MSITYNPPVKQVTAISEFYDKKRAPNIQASFFKSWVDIVIFFAN